MEVSVCAEGGSLPTTYEARAVQVEDEAIGCAQGLCG